MGKLKVLTLINFVLILLPLLFVPHQYKQWVVVFLSLISLLIVFSLMWDMSSKEELEEYHEEYVPGEPINDGNSLDEKSGSEDGEGSVDSDNNDLNNLLKKTKHIAHVE